MNFIKYLPILIVLILFNACSKCPDDEVIGDYKLSEITESRISYLGVDTVVFINADSLEKKFAIDDYRSSTRSDQVIETCVGASVLKRSSYINIDFEVKSNILYSPEDTFDIFYSSSWIPIDTLTVENIEENIAVYDFLSVQKRNKRYTFNNQIVSDSRETTDEFLDSITVSQFTKFIDDTIIQNVQLENVYMIQSNDSMGLFFSFENGIEGYMEDEEFWVLDRMY